MTNEKDFDWGPPPPPPLAEEIIHGMQKEFRAKIAEIIAKHGYDADVELSNLFRQQECEKRPYAFLFAWQYNDSVRAIVHANFAGWQDSGHVFNWCSLLDNGEVEKGDVALLVNECLREITDAMVSSAAKFTKQYIEHSSQICDALVDAIGLKPCKEIGVWVGDEFEGSDEMLSIPFFGYPHGQQDRLVRLLDVYLEAEKCRQSLPVEEGFIGIWGAVRIIETSMSSMGNEFVCSSRKTGTMVCGLSDRKGLLFVHWETPPSKQEALCYCESWSNVGQESYDTVYHAQLYKGYEYKSTLSKWATCIDRADYACKNLGKEFQWKVSIEKTLPAPRLLLAENYKVEDEKPFRAWAKTIWRNTTGGGWDIPTLKKYIVLTEAEELFLKTQTIPNGHALLPQFFISNSPEHARFVDFVLFRKEDCVPVMAFEIDGKTHAPNMINDALRDKEITDALGCSVKHIDAADIYKNARRLGLISRRGNK